MSILNEYIGDGEMDIFTQPIYFVMSVFILLAFVIWISWLIYTYKKYKLLSLSKTLISFSFIFYFFAAFFLVLLPLPEIRDTCSTQQPGTQHYSLVPFRFLSEIFENSQIVWSQPETYIYLFKQSAFYQAFFNFLLLMPFGVYLRYFLKQKRYWPLALGTTFVLTLLYEMTQVTGVFGYYNCAYRIFDVDDLILNSFGGIVGFFVAPAVFALFPSKEKINSGADILLKLDEVKSIIVLLSVFMDLLMTDVVTQIIMSLTSRNEVNELIIRSISLFVFLFVIPILWNGRTMGTFIFHFRYDSKVSRIVTINRLFKRFIAFYVTFFIIFVLNVVKQSQISMDSPYYHVASFLSLGTEIIVGILTIVLFIHIMLVVFGKGKRRFYFDEASNLYTTRKM